MLREGDVLSTQLGPADEWPCRAALLLLLLLLGVFSFTPGCASSKASPAAGRACGSGMDPSTPELPGMLGQRLDVEILEGGGAEHHLHSTLWVQDTCKPPWNPVRKKPTGGKMG